MATAVGVAVAATILLTNLIRAEKVAGVLGLLFVAATAFRHLGSGGPTSPARGCPYRLVDHGEYSCVSRSTYLAAAAAEQRLASGAFLSFFVVQFGVAAAELRRRRGRTSDEDREPPATTDERLVPGA